MDRGYIDFARLHTFTQEMAFFVIRGKRNVDFARLAYRVVDKLTKQHLRNKAFYGTSQNAVKTQVWIAIGVYVLVTIVKKELTLGRSLYEILPISRVALFERTPICEVFAGPIYQNEDTPRCNHLALVDV